MAIKAPGSLAWPRTYTIAPGPGSGPLVRRSRRDRLLVVVVGGCTGRRRHGGLGCAHGLGDHRICRPDAHGRVSTGSGSGGPAWTTTLLLLPGACARVRDEATSAHLTETLAPGGVGPIPTKIMQAALHWQAAVRFDGNTGPVDRKARLLRYARMCDNADLHGLARGHVYRLYFG